MGQTKISHKNTFLQSDTSKIVDVQKSYQKSSSSIIWGIIGMLSFFKKKDHPIVIWKGKFVYNYLRMVNWDKVKEMHSVTFCNITTTIIPRFGDEKNLTQKTRFTHRKVKKTHFPKMVPKVISFYYLRSYEHFKFLEKKCIL